MEAKGLVEAPPTVLLVSNDPEAAKWLEAAAQGLQVRQVAPRELDRSPEWLDAAVAVAHWRSEDGPSALDALAALRELPVAERLLLVAEAGDPVELERLIAALQPQAWLPDPPPTPSLTLALRQALPSANPGAGARRGQRPATVLLGVSAAIREVLDQIRQVAPSQASVLILGETGTGKELAARAVHEQSERSSGPFIAINCGAMPETLLESELFGACKGAFTGSERDRTGLFEQAHGGTLFLDEIGDTTPSLQTKLLRVLEEREVRPIGGDKTRPIDGRIVSATHQDIEESIRKGTFRQDLFYRLNTVALRLPPCAGVGWTSPSWPSTSPRSSARRTPARSPSARSSSTPSRSRSSRATCGSSATPWRGPSP
ncbi:MAG: hypothetical protein CL910_08380 [Deltaproteobacteria bacterium]|nr:hypothetical protein [Deltaproteobacteria bacterium]